MQAANCQIRARRHAAPNGETRPRSLVLREPRHANGLGIEDGARPGVQALVAQGWRSVSLLHGIGTSCVILAGDSASPFLQDVQGRLIVNGEGDEGGGCRWDIVSHRRGSQ
jgi:hypothetical protein